MRTGRSMVMEYKIQVDDIKVNYVHEGDGEKLLLLHGENESWKIYKKYIPVLSRHFEVFAPDGRNQGKTEKGVKPVDYDSFALDTAGFCDALGIEKFHVIGYSDGGKTALLLAALYPERVKSIVLMGTPARAEGYLDSLWKNVKSLGKFLEFSAKMSSGKKSESYRRSIYFWNLLQHQRENTKEEMNAIVCPCSIISGRHDVLKDEESAYIHENIADSELHYIDYAGHSEVVHNKISMPIILDFYKQKFGINMD
jgi:pimeloyl-ACP methyl ester carboxylesterase